MTLPPLGSTAVGQVFLDLRECVHLCWPGFGVTRLPDAGKDAGAPRGGSPVRVETRDIGTVAMELGLVSAIDSF